MRSALFVDFDNVYTQLRQLEPEAAERFARRPVDWIHWLVDSLALPEPHVNGAQRRLLVRRCYLNPTWYQNYRHSFLKAGFEIVDCPPVTSQGKTSTDIHMVLDVVELLQHETRYDEFIVFSADADFTPVLRKLRRHDRRTTVLAIGFPSAAYQASADLLIDERLFIQTALGFGADPAEPVYPAAQPEPGADASRTEGGGLQNAGDEHRPTRPATHEEIRSIANHILMTVERSPMPVSAASLASRIKHEHPHVAETWYGLGTFKQFFRSLALTQLAWANGSGGRIYDPARHQIESAAAADEPEATWGEDDATYRLAREVSTLTGAPLLSPADLRTVLELLADDLANHSFELAATARRVCDRFAESKGKLISAREVSFLIRGMQLNGHFFGQGRDDIRTLAERVFNQVLFLCEREQMMLDEAATRRIRQWIGGDLLGAPFEAGGG